MCCPTNQLPCTFDSCQTCRCPSDEDPASMPDAQRGTAGYTGSVRARRDEPGRAGRGRGTRLAAFLTPLSSGRCHSRSGDRGACGRPHLWDPPILLRVTRSPSIGPEARLDRCSSHCMISMECAPTRRMTGDGTTTTHEIKAWSRRLTFGLPQSYPDHELGEVSRKAGHTKAQAVIPTRTQDLVRKCDSI